MGQAAQVVFLHSSLNLEMAPVCTTQRQVVHKSTITLFPGWKQNQSQVFPQPDTAPASPLKPACLPETASSHHRDDVSLASCGYSILPPTLRVDTGKRKRGSQTVGKVLEGNTLCDCVSHVLKTMATCWGAGQEVSVGQPVQALKSGQCSPTATMRLKIPKEVSSFPSIPS